MSESELAKTKEELTYEELYEVAEHLRIRVLEFEAKFLDAQKRYFQLADELRAEREQPPRYEQYYKEGCQPIHHPYAGPYTPRENTQDQT